jgi:type II secretory pathway pseudopilin PulG
MTLAELLAVVVMLGIFASIAAMRVGQNSQKSFASGGNARRLALDLLQCQRRAISTGKDHYVQFTPTTGNATGYTVYRKDTASSSTAVDAAFNFDQGETVTPSANILEYQFDGTCLAAYTITFTKPSATTVTVSTVVASGAIRVQ